MANVLQMDLPWLILRSKLTQEDRKGILYRTMFDDYILDNSKFQMVILISLFFKLIISFVFFIYFSLMLVLWKIYICGKICF